MCYSGKCLCLKVETGSLIFGVFSAVVTGIVSVFYIVSLICLNSMSETDWEEYGFPYKSIFKYHDQRMAVNGLLSLSLIKTLVDFLFAVLLCNGVCKKNPGHVKAYFIYGVVMAVLSGLLVMISFLVLDVEAFAILLALFVAYCMILHMVNMTYNKISAGEVYQFQHKRLVETVY